MTGIEGRCEGCGRSWKVPSRDRRYSCRECGGVVVAMADTSPIEGEPEQGLAEEDPESGPGGAACVACGEPMEDDADFCVACGAPRGEAVSRDDAEERRAAGREYGRVKSIVGALRLLYGVTAFFWLLMVVGLLFVDPLVEEGDLEGLTETDRWVAMAIAAPMLLLYIWGVFGVRRHPFVWSVILASLQTLSTALRILTDDGVFLIILSGLFTLLHWAGVKWAARLDAILKRYPEFAIKRFSGKNVKDVPSLARQARARVEARRRRWIYAGIFLVAFVGLLAFGVHHVTRSDRVDGLRATEAPSPEGGVFRRLQDAWAASNHDGIIALMDPESTRLADGWRRIVKRRDWGGALPELTESTLDWKPGSTRARSHHAFSDGESEGLMELRWEYRSKEWYLSGLRLP